MMVGGAKSLASFCVTVVVLPVWLVSTSRMVNSPTPNETCRIEASQRIKHRPSPLAGNGVTCQLSQLAGVWPAPTSSDHATRL